jgi:hypothetical protein
MNPSVKEIAMATATPKNRTRRTTATPKNRTRRTTATPKSRTDRDTAGVRAQELNDRFADTGRKVGSLYLDSYEKTVDGFVSAERKLAERAPVPFTSELVNAHADLTHDLSKACVKVAREILA